MFRIVMTGGPCSGKTSLVNYFAEQDVQVVPEAAIQVIERLIETYGKEEFLLWKAGNFHTFQMLIFNQQLEDEAQLDPSKLTIFDRSTIDSVAYLYHVGISPSKSMLNKANAHPYDLILLCETLTNFDSRTASGRTESYDESVQISNIIESAYQQFDYSPIHLPAIPIEERLRLMDQHISQLQKKPIH